ncbi:hypothetical protein [Xenorhabdus bovienii]|uniref:hypothetical protein n=1 Tax=Xenorhabdus bovienii TaxID=40576 RepID=UPI003DA61D51
MTLHLAVDKKNVILIECTTQEIGKRIKRYYPTIRNLDGIVYDNYYHVNVIVTSKKDWKYRERNTFIKCVNYKNDIVFYQYQWNNTHVILTEKNSDCYCYQVPLNFTQTNAEFTVMIASIDDAIYLVRFLRALIAEIHYLAHRKCYHSALVNYRGKGVLIIGDSGAGKTSLTLLLASAGGKILSNDKLFIGTDDTGKPEAWPHVTSIRMGAGLLNTLDNLLLSQLVSERSGSARKYLADIARQGDFWGNKNKFELTSVETSKLFNCQIINHSLVDLVIFSYKAENGQLGSISSSCFSAHRELLNSNYFQIRDTDYPESIFGTDPIQTSPPDHLTQLPCHLLYFNPFNGLSYVTEYLDRL